MSKLVFLLVVCSLVFTESARPEVLAPSPRSSEWIQWTNLPSLPEGLEAKGAFVGVSNGALIVAGGVTSGEPQAEDDNDGFSENIYVLLPGEEKWRAAGVLPRPAAFGATASDGRRVYLAGGRNEEGVLSDAFSLEWIPDGKEVIRRDLPHLPQAVSDCAGAVLGNQLFVVGGLRNEQLVHRTWSLGLDPHVLAGESNWKEAVAYPEPARYGSALVCQGNGESRSLFLIGGYDEERELCRVDRLDFDSEGTARHWLRCADLPRCVGWPSALSWGQSHLFVFGAPARGDTFPAARKEDHPFSHDCLAYHTITDTWVQFSKCPEGLAPQSTTKWNGGLVLLGREIAPGKHGSKSIQGVLPRAKQPIAWQDYVAVAVYLVALAFIGVTCARTNRSTSDFFLGGHRIPWWAAGLSLLATQVSSIGILAIPAKSYATDWTYFAGVATWFIVVPIVTNLFIPFFRHLNVTSAYEYLEIRFSPAVRIFASLSYCLLQLGRLAVVMYLPALALSSVSGINVLVPIIAMGVICTTYTVVGGMRAIIWTDVIQSVVLVSGMLLCLISVVCQIPGGLASVIEIAKSHDKLQIVRTGWDPFHATLWVILIGNVFVRLSNLTSDQAVVQRYLTTRDAEESKKALWTDVFISIPWALLVFSLGTALFVFYQQNPGLLDPNIDTDGIVPLFIAQQLPSGVSGIVIAAIVAAALSDMYSSLLTISTLVVTDFYSRLRPAANETNRMTVARISAILVGLFGTFSAALLAQTNVTSLWDTFQFILGMIVGSLGGLFILGVFTMRANSSGAFVGAVASSLALGWVMSQTHLHFFLFAAIGAVACVSVGYLGSLILPGRRETAGLTAFSSGRTAVFSPKAGTATNTLNFGAVVER